jgi:colanic acid biosynthesis glycosyl transferase WcaI
MRILYISQYFPPEAGATQTRAYEMARNLVRMGHQVTMITEMPNHPSGIISPEYRRKVFERKILEGIEVIRVWVKASPKKNFRNRMLFYLTFMLNGSLAGIFLANGHYDLIYASSPPLFVGGAALALSWLKRIHMVFEVRDLWPESAVALGELSNPRAISLASKLENACYQRARIIIVVTRGIMDKLRERGIPADKLALIPNGANIDLFSFKPEGRERIRQELHLVGKFVAIYAGIHGIAQGLETILEVAQGLQNTPEVHLLLIGNGPIKSEIVTAARLLKLTNLTLLDEQPRTTIPDYLSAADVALIPLRKLEIFKGALPSKMFDAWACSRPILLSVDGEARQVMEQAGGGIFVPPENAGQMQAAILKLMKDTSERQRMGNNGRAYTELNYSRSALAEKLASV